MLIGAAAGIGVLVLSAAAPATAHADIPIVSDIGGVLGDILRAPAGAISGQAAKLAVEAFEGILKSLFGWPAKLINKTLLAWLTEVPDFEGRLDPATGRPVGNQVAALTRTVSGMAFAAMGGVLTLSVIRFWAAGVLHGNGGYEALQGLARVVVAALFIVLWPWLYHQIAGLANASSAALLGNDQVMQNTATILGAAFAAGVVLNILSVLMAIAAAVLFLGLLVTKLAVSITTLLLFVGMPLAIIAWAAGADWVLRVAVRAMAVALLIPSCWALCFAVTGAVSVDALTLNGGSKLIDALLQPLVALALLWIVVTLPKTLARMVMLGALPMSGNGFVSRAVSYAAGRAISEGAGLALASAMPTTERPGRAGQIPLRDAHARTERSVTRREHVKRAAAGAAATAATGAAGAAAAAGAGAGRTALPGAVPAAKPAESHGAPRTGWTAPAGATPVTRRAEARGLRQGPWTAQVEDRVRQEMQAAQEREQDPQRRPTRAEVAQAMTALPPETQSAIAAFAEERQGNVRGAMAYQASFDEWSIGEREAFRTLAAAPRAERAAGMADALRVPPADTSAPVLGEGIGDRGAHTDSGSSAGATRPSVDLSAPGGSVFRDTSSGARTGELRDTSAPASARPGAGGSPAAGQHESRAGSSAPPRRPSPPDGSEGGPATPPSRGPAGNEPPAQ